MVSYVEWAMAEQQQLVPRAKLSFSFLISVEFYFYFFLDLRFFTLVCVSELMSFTAIVSLLVSLLPFLRYNLRIFFLLPLGTRLSSSAVAFACPDRIIINYVLCCMFSLLLKLILNCIYIYSTWTTDHSPTELNLTLNACPNEFLAKNYLLHISEARKHWFSLASVKFSQVPKI